MLTLAIESSCDDTAVAIMNGETILADLRSGQDSIHTQFGGVVPELASREHLKAIQPLVVTALVEAQVNLRDIELIAATQKPGLIGSLLVGFSYAKALAYALKIPLIGVDHMAGHILSVFLSGNRPSFPFISLLVSGGSSALYLAEDWTHYRCLGRTRDDAAGEAFDKTAKMLGLPYPGGRPVSQYAEKGDSTAYSFPRAWLGDSYDFSFSGVKTSVLNQINSLRQKKGKENKEDQANICASFEEAIVDVLSTKTIRASQEYKVHDVAIGGGVAANKRLRQRLTSLCHEQHLTFHAPPFEFCTDNAAMIGLAGQKHFTENGGCNNICSADVVSRSDLGI